MKSASDLLGTFAHHRVAANLLMLIMLLAGGFALDRLNVQFFPNFQLDLVSVSVVWTGASAEDIEEGITNPLEQRLRSVDHLHKLTSKSVQGVSTITLEFEEGTDPLLALDHTRRLVDEQRNLPNDAEKPQVLSVTRYEPVARLLVTGLASRAELRRLVRRFEDELLQKGVDKVDISGLPEEEIAIQVDPLRLDQLGIGLDQIGDRVAALSRDQPAGILGRIDGARELRSLGQRRDPVGFARLPLVTEAGVRIELGDMARIERRPRADSLLLTVGGKPAAELAIKRTEGGDSLQAARVVADWLATTRPRLPPGVQIQLYDEAWQLIRDRIMLLIWNGSGGLFVVVVVLYLFLTGRVTFWVAMGIPTSFMATLFALWLVGGSINMVSLFALIMALGIIVDDAIVVGEDALAHYQAGEAALRSAEGGARRMLAPVLASSLTTVAAFLPLMLVGGTMGKLLFDIPLVIVCVMSASLIESFLVLPGHLRHAFRHIHSDGSQTMRMRLDQGFDWFRERAFRPLVRVALVWRGVTISLALGLLILAAGLLAGGRVGFDFFPSPESQILYANASFVAGTPRATVDTFLDHLDKTLFRAERALGSERLIQVAVAQHGSTVGDPAGNATGDTIGSLMVELTPSDQRSVRNEILIRAWHTHIHLPAGLENFTITSRRPGPPGRDLTLRLTGPDATELKQAALALREALTALPGVSSADDDLPFGREQLIYTLSPAGEAEGLSIVELGRQLRAAFDGRLIQIFQDGPEEIEVRVTLPEWERGRMAALQRLNVRLPSGEQVPLSAVAQWDTRRGFEALRHAEGQLAVEVAADVDTTRTTTNEIVATLQATILPELAQQYGVGYSFEGRSAEQRETLADMRKGALFGLLLIYLVLAWVFGSYGRPLVVMTAIPFGLVGALFGHWIMGLKLTVLSLFGLFGLSGIVVNDSIILVSFYQELRQTGKPRDEALEEAACQRLRAVLLTSLTTIGGLLPLLTETSLQAQFLIPMATSIAFGLAFTTMLVLFFVPALLSIHESVVGHLERAARSRGLKASEECEKEARGRRVGEI